MTKTFVRSPPSATMIGLAALLTALGAAPSLASCYAPGQQPKATIAELQGSLTKLLGGDAEKNASAIIATVRDLAATDPGSLSFILANLAAAGESQRASIGTGLGQAATICQRNDLAFAADIPTQLLVADQSINDKAAEAAFALATGQQPIGASGGGGGGGGSGSVSGGASGGQTSPYASPTVSGAGSFQTLGTYSTKATINLLTLGGNGSSSYTYGPILRSVSTP